MNDMVEVTIPVEGAVAKALRSPRASGSDWAGAGPVDPGRAIAGNTRGGHRGGQAGSTGERLTDADAELAA